MAKAIQVAVLSKDTVFLSIFQDITSKLALELVELDDAARYLDLISQEPFDILILDCHGSSGAKHLVSTVRQASANREAILMIATNPDEMSAALDFGTHVALARPVTHELAERRLRDALPVIQERHRRYDRHPLEMDVFIACDAKNWGLTAKSVNLSEGGVAVQLPQWIDLSIEDVVRIIFQLPDEGTGQIETAASLSWINNDLQAGFRFKPLTLSNSARLSAWLNQHAAPRPGAARKQIVESWLTQHGKESGTVIISAGLRSQLLPQRKPATPPAEDMGKQIRTTTPESTGKTSSRFRWYLIVIAGFLLGIVIGLVAAKVIHLL